MPERRPPAERGEVQPLATTVETLMAGRQSQADTAPAPAPGTDAPSMHGRVIGRFVVLATLGVGGAGVVVAAYDPTLERKVAIKLLRADRVVGAATRGRATIVAEAQALARLSHPHVVSVHEIVFIDGAACLVMDHIPGPTLRGWLAERPRPWREVLAMFRGAGEGLAAAHREGIVHRDFKPDNVLVDPDGRARVVDFGLAAAIADPASTGPGARAGTIPYMAPEQLAGEHCDARADQFAFCVALWEALHGTRPFAGTTADELAAAIAGGGVREPARSTPAWVRTALIRGLQADPGARWPSLDALLGALGRDPRATRRRRAIAVGAIALGAGLLWAMWPSAAAVDPCAGAAARLAGVWDGSRKAAVHAAFAATRLAHADGTWQRVSARVDDYVAGWVGMAGEACRATRIEGRQSDTMLDLRMVCLEDRRSVLGALTALWAGGMTAETLEHAVGAARRLPPLVECADSRALTEQVRPPADPAHAASVAATRPKLDAVRALILAHRWDEARDAAAAVRVEADATGWPALRAEAAFAQGEVLANLSEAGAEPPLIDAVRLAGAAHDDRLVARALTVLVDNLGFHQQHAERALQLADLADGAVARAGDDPELRALLRVARADALVTSARYEEARAVFLDARAEFARMPGADGLDLVLCDGELASVAAAMGDYATANRLGREVLAAAVTLVGPDHPRVAAILNLLGMTTSQTGDHAAAGAYYRRALEIKLGLFGPDAASTALAMNNLATAELELGHLDEAQRLLERALAVRERVLGPEHGYVGDTLGNLAAVRRKQGRHAEALQLAERALAITIKVRGAEHPSSAYKLIAIAEVLRVRGDHVRALDAYQRAAAIRRKALGPDHSLTLEAVVQVAGELEALGRCGEARLPLASAVAGLAKAVGADGLDSAQAIGVTAKCALVAGSAAQAVAGLERAVAIYQERGDESVNRGALRWGLARALWAAGRPAEAITAARTAEHELGIDADGAVERGAVHAWLATHRR